MTKAAGTKSKRVVKIRQNYALENINKAKVAMDNGASAVAVSEQYGIPRTTCYDIKNGRYKSYQLGSSTYLDHNVEKLLASAICQLQYKSKITCTTIVTK